MSDSDRFDSLVGHLVTTARAHHEATGGVNLKWAAWYSERLVDDVNSVLGSGYTVEELAEWLAEADHRYQSDEQELSWPKAYAAWLLEENAG